MIWRHCSVTGVVFEIGQDEIDFLARISPVFNGEKYLIPPPTICPEERLRRRLSFRNLRNLYKRQCDLSGKTILSMLEPGSAAPVYHSDEWWSDKWDPISYGRDYDFSRPFFEQFNELYSVVPRIHSYVILSENCDFINGAANCKNCYLSFNMDYCEDCFYLNSGVHCRNCVNSLALTNCELCFECTDCDGCYELHYSDLCSNCSSSYFLTSCRRCTNCIACTNLVDKQYCIFNEQRTKEEFERIAALLRRHSEVEKLRVKAGEHSLRFPRKNYFGSKNENFSGNSVSHIKNSFECFDSNELENCKYCFYAFKASNCMDYTIFGDSSEWIYQCLATGLNCSFDAFCAGCWGGSSHNMYCMTIASSNHCFGCVSLKRKEYCILNKQYTKEDYEALLPRIIEHMTSTEEWGEFFPPSISPFYFNETVGFDEYPIAKAEAMARGYRWRAEVKNESIAVSTDYVDDISDADDSVISKPMTCEMTGAPFKVIQQELKFYRQLGIPLPRLCPNERYRRLLNRRTPRKLWDRNCEQCGKSLKAVYAPGRKEVVYCEECYSSSVL